jgi:hypothetical protein
MLERDQLRTPYAARAALTHALALVIGWALAAPAFAQDDLPEEEPEEDVKKRFEEDDDIDLLDDEEELDKIERPTDNGTDLLGEEEDTPIRSGVGVDTADGYRDYQTQVRELGPDEEVLAWEQYLESFPNSLLKDRIQKRIDELMGLMYGDKIDREDDSVDAGKRDIDLAQPFSLEPTNPRQRLNAGFEWGLPNYMNLAVDYEHAILRELSIHAGLRRRYSGWSIEGGPRWAFVKSTRTNTVVALIGDFRVNTDPAFLSLKPQLAAGKKFGPVDIQLQAGIDFDTRPGGGLPIIGGGNVTYNATDVVSLFAETLLYMKTVSSEIGALSFRFNTATFGLRFHPEMEAEGDLNIGLGATVPYTSNYWMFHFGAIATQVTYTF